LEHPADTAADFERRTAIGRQEQRQIVGVDQS
jgi:hypothetical protein